MPKTYIHVQTVMPTVGEQVGGTRALQAASRLEELNRHAERGWELVTSVAIPAIDTLTILDTLGRDKQQPGT
ncbi:hypothetical protein [Agromyces sp. Soil535]|uniref:hypothetical protein n=1 Tax=Agromyces sp. Soil535 TaxID=1736390 RepID=UPI0007158BE3|nr:hypothetical protein [Agromyces sp. Soil535]KRE28232.1 hypothetical protein ASG80_21370 [Agromyces sp. Soil535]